MAFADPQSITIDGVTSSLPRVSSGVNAGSFKSNDGLLTLSVSHAYGKRTRRVIRLDSSKVAADPFDSSLNAQYSMGTYLVVDQPVVGYTVADLAYNIEGFFSLLAASSNAALIKLLGGEN